MATIPCAPFTYSQLTRPSRTTSPKPMVAMARKTPLSRSTGRPSGTATSAGSRADTARATGKGRSAFMVARAPA